VATARLKDLARKTGFSISTVSRALLGYRDVNPKTRERILEAARELNYYPFQAGKQLRSGKTHTVGFLIPTYGKRFSDPFFIELLSGIGDMASTLDYDILVGTSGGGGKEIEAYRRIVGSGRVDGLIITRTKINDERITYLLETKTPFVVLGRVNNAPNAPFIDIDSKAGIKQLTEKLIELGHRRIALITSPNELIFTRYRNEGYREALLENGIEIDETLIAIGNLTQESGRQCALELLKQKNRPTAIVAVNDLMALGAYSAVQQSGLEIGKDVSVTGYDGISMAENAHPPLTTIEVPIYEIGKRLFEILFKIINHQKVEHPQILLPPKPVFRASIGKPPGTNNPSHTFKTGNDLSVGEKKIKPKLRRIL